MDELPDPVGEPLEETDAQHSTDPALPGAKQYLMETYFKPGTKRVYYQRQLQVLAENNYFHWITAFALADLGREGSIGTETEPLRGGLVRYYWALGHRDRKRQTRAVRVLLEEMAEPGFASGVGRHAETMIDAAFPRIGLRPVKWDVREYQGRAWKETGHDLDRVFELDGVAYGVEVKNQLQYIGRDEFQVKLAMCHELGLKPLFVMRMLPRSYVNEVVEQGGYAMVLKYQLYPHGSSALARRVREELGLPVDSPPADSGRNAETLLELARKDA